MMKIYVNGFLAVNVHMLECWICFFLLDHNHVRALNILVNLIEYCDNVKMKHFKLCWDSLDARRDKLILFDGVRAWFDYHFVTKFATNSTPSDWYLLCKFLFVLSCNSWKTAWEHFLYTYWEKIMIQHTQHLFSGGSGKANTIYFGTREPVNVKWTNISYLF